MSVHVQRLAILALLACVDLLCDLLPLLHSTPHEAATQVLDRLRNQLHLSIHVPEADGIYEETPIRPDDGAYLRSMASERVMS